MLVLLSGVHRFNAYVMNLKAQVGEDPGIIRCVSV